MITAYKDDGRTPLVDPLGRALAQALKAATADMPTDGPFLVVPVPSARRAVRRRGHDHMRRMAEAAVRELRRAGLPATGLAALRQCRRVRDQAALSRPARAANLAGALETHPAADVAGRTALLADDVLTSGHTLAEATRALEEAGADVPAAATVAVTLRRPGS
ncbi:ComF family protein [Actinomadura hibisca]|uniref:ComF family protein n=1 Tax=Actinomadura hibisca TaxID=68565 RepID=UPI001FDFF41A|nr:phosphoribosyltransferase family protein [Actinomadura hibisca]